MITYNRKYNQILILLTLLAELLTFIVVFQYELIHPLLNSELLFRLMEPFWSDLAFCFPCIMIGAYFYLRTTKEDTGTVNKKYYLFFAFTVISIIACITAFYYFQNSARVILWSIYLIFVFVNLVVFYLTACLSNDENITIAGKAYAAAMILESLLMIYLIIQ